MQLSDKINKKTTLNNSVRFFVLCVQMAEKVSSTGPDPSFLARSGKNGHGSEAIQLGVQQLILTNALKKVIIQKYDFLKEKVERQREGLPERERGRRKLKKRRK